MAAADKISRKKPQSKALDFEVLHELGIKYVRRIAGQVWSDYNLHDPGVTILDQLCYAITDLAYRTNYPIEQLLAPNPDDEQSVQLKNFFTARDILTCNPVTISDFRKLIIDVVGVKNAWLETTDKAELELYYDEANNQLVYKGQSKPGQELLLYNGLYQGVIEFEEDPDYGDLNANTIEAQFTVSNAESLLNGYTFEALGEFPYWDEEDLDWNNLAEIRVNLLKLAVPTEDEYNNLTITYTLNDDQSVTTGIIKTTNVGTSREEGLEAELNQAVDLFLYDTGNAVAGGSLLQRYQAKVFKVQQILHQVTSKLHKHRNLCEDFISFKALKVEEVGICADILLAPDANKEEVLGQIWYQIDRFMSPRVRFHTLEALLERGMPADEIFEGPPLDHGFILDDELIGTDRNRKLRVSDLINIVMDVKGVVAVNNMVVASFDEGKEGPGSPDAPEHWCLELKAEGNSVVRLSTDRSKITFFKEGIPQSANKTRAEALFKSEKRKEDQQKQTESKAWDIPLAEGQYRDLSVYSSIQQDFPDTFGIDQDGLPGNATPLRRAQAHQLKGYLMFFEQQLANYLAQLANIRELFAMNPGKQRTYFTQALYNLPKAADLFKDFIEPNGFTGNYEQDKANDFDAKWAAFMADENNNYRTTIDRIAEGVDENGDSQFEIRRNRFLDHLMARFAEQFSEYALLMHDINDDISYRELMNDKMQLLQHYPAISSGRGKGYDKTDQVEIWNTDNVTGLQHRLARMLGIDNPNRRYLGKSGLIDSPYTTITEVGGNYTYTIKNEGGRVLLKTDKPYDTRTYIYVLLRTILREGVNKPKYDGEPSNYEVQQDGPEQFTYVLKDDEGTVLGVGGQSYTTEEACRLGIEEARLFLVENYDNNEGLHVIEHLLLRPIIENHDALLPVELEEDEETPCPCTKDPYSFRISIYLPAWPVRFTDIEFRKFIERKIRLETPAHVFPKICWLDKDQMDDFEADFVEWLMALAEIDFDVVTFLAGRSPKDILDELGPSIMAKQQEMTELLAHKKEGKPKPKAEPFEMAEGPLHHKAAQLKDTLSQMIETVQGKAAAKEGKPALPKLFDLSMELPKMRTVLERAEAAANLSEAQQKLVTTMTTLRNVYPYATLHDCEESEGENPVSLDNTVLGTFKPLEDE